VGLVSLRREPPREPASASTAQAERFEAPSASRIPNGATAPASGERARWVQASSANTGAAAPPDGVISRSQSAGMLPGIWPPSAIWAGSVRLR
jgi:hypothetical protein